MTIVNVNKLFQERSLFFVADCCVRARSSAAAAAGVLGGVLFDFFIAVRIARRCATTRVRAPQTHSACRGRVSRQHADLRVSYHGTHGRADNARTRRPAE